MKAKYINPYTDFGFKKIFGEEASKPLLIDFLNALLPEKNRIVDLTFKNAEQLGQTDLDRKAIDLRHLLRECQGREIHCRIAESQAELF